MYADVVVDLQFGSTAKGKLCQWLAVNRKYDAAIRAQSINAGHTVIVSPTGEQESSFVEFKMQTIPCGWVNPNTTLILAAGAFIDLKLLEHEIAMVESVGFPVKDRLLIDHRAWIIQPEDFKAEEDMGIVQKMGSTGHAAGASLIRKLWRATTPTRVRDFLWWFDARGLKVCDTIERMYGMERVLVEGCQGTMLSIHTSDYYPYVTSRECTASGIIAECGISPRAVDDIYGVMRTYPIRVGGNSGHTGSKELSWDEIRERSGDDLLKPEITTVTKRERRIFELSVQDLEHALMVNEPTRLCLTFVDYLNHQDRDATEYDDLSPEAKKWIRDLEGNIKRKIDWFSTGKMPQSVIDRTGE